MEIKGNDKTIVIEGLCDLYQKLCTEIIRLPEPTDARRLAQLESKKKQIDDLLRQWK